MPPARPERFVAWLLGLSLLASLGMTGRDTLGTLADTWREVSSHDTEELRQRHHGWYARLTEVIAVVERDVPVQEPIVLDNGSVPSSFVAAFLPRHAIWKHSPQLVAEWTAAGRAWWELRLRVAQPLQWSLQRMNASGLPGEEAR